MHSNCIEMNRCIKHFTKQLPNLMFKVDNGTASPKKIYSFFLLWIKSLFWDENLMVFFFGSNVFNGFLEDWRPVLEVQPSEREKTNRKWLVSKSAECGKMADGSRNCWSKRKLVEKHRTGKHLLRWLEVNFMCEICKSCVYWSETWRKF